MRTSNRGRSMQIHRTIRISSNGMHQSTCKPRQSDDTLLLPIPQTSLLYLHASPCILSRTSTKCATFRFLSAFVQRMITNSPDFWSHHDLTHSSVFESSAFHMIPILYTAAISKQLQFISPISFQFHETLPIASRNASQNKHTHSQSNKQLRPSPPWQRPSSQQPSYSTPSLPSPSRRQPPSSCESASAGTSPPQSQ